VVEMTEIKNQFRQRVPGFVDGDNPLEFDFDITEELVNHSYIQEWLNENPHSILVKSGGVLMVVYNEGFNWCGIGWITNPDDLELPEWEGGKYIAQYSNGNIEVLGKISKNPVVSSCGGVLTLKDGTKCKKIKYEDWKK
jgi:hypothetical protein